MPTNGNLAKIHIAKKDLGLTDEAYRDIIAINFPGKSSAKALTKAEQGRLLDLFRARGWQSKGPARKGRKPFAQTPSGTPPLRGELIKKIEAHLTLRGLHWNYAHAMAKRICKVERVEWCDDGQLWKLVAAFEYDSKRKGIDNPHQKPVGTKQSGR